MSSSLKRELEEEKQKSKMWMGLGITFMIIGGLLLMFVIYLIYNPREKIVEKITPVDTFKIMKEEAARAKLILKTYNDELNGAAENTATLGPSPKLTNECATKQCPPAECSVNRDNGRPPATNTFQNRPFFQPQQSFQPRRA